MPMMHAPVDDVKAKQQDEDANSKRQAEDDDDEDADRWRVMSRLLLNLCSPKCWNINKRVPPTVVQYMLCVCIKLYRFGRTTKVHIDGSITLCYIYCLFSGLPCEQSGSSSVSVSTERHSAPIHSSVQLLSEFLSQPMYAMSPSRLM